MIIGITGKSGSGKSTYAEKLAENTDYYVIHVDDISHEVMELDHVKSKLISIFGHNVLHDGKINRKYIGDLVFTTRHVYNSVSKLIWNEVKIKIDNILTEHDNIILDWILLPHSHYWTKCDKKILIIADEKIRKEKVMQRDSISVEYLEKRDSAGIPYDNIIFDEIVKNEYK